MDRALNLTVPGGGDSRVWGTLDAGSYAFTKLGQGTLDVGTLSSNGGSVTVAEGSLTMQTISNTGSVSYTVNTLATLNMGPTPYVFSSDRNFILNEGSKFKVTGTGASTFANANLQLNISAGSIQASTISAVKLFVSGGTSGLTLNPHIQILGLSGTSVVLKNSPLLLSDVLSCSDPLGAALAVSGTLAFDRNAFYTITNTDKLIATFNGTLSSIDKTAVEDLSLPSRWRSIGKVFDSLNMGGTLSSEVVSAVSRQNNAIAKLGGNGDAKARVLTQMAPSLVADSARSGIARLGALGETIENRVDLVEAVAASSATFSYSSDTVFFDPNNQVPMRISKNEEPREWEAWASAYTSSANQKAEPAEGIFSGSSTRGTGGALGVERTLGGLRLGLMGATGAMRASGDNAQVNSDSWHLGLYAVLPMEQFVVDSSVLFGLSENDSKRTDLGGFQYQSKFQSQDFRASFGFAIFLLPADSAFETASVFRVSYLRYSQTASNETEASNLGLPTHLDGFSDYGVTTKVGQRFRFKLRARDVEYSADGGAYWQHNLPRDSKTVGANFVGISNTNFTIQGANRSADDTVLEGGISATFKDKHSVRLGVTSKFSGTTGTSTTGLLSFSTQF